MASLLPHAAELPLITTSTTLLGSLTIYVRTCSVHWTVALMLWDWYKKAEMRRRHSRTPLRNETWRGPSLRTSHSVPSCCRKWTLPQGIIPYGCTSQDENECKFVRSPNNRRVSNFPSKWVSELNNKFFSITRLRWRCWCSEDKMKLVPFSWPALNGAIPMTNGL